jgi:hypothetical protein
MRCRIIAPLLVLLMFCVHVASAQEVPDLPRPAPPTDLEARDKPWDIGESVDLTWDASPDEARLSAYRIYRSLARKPVTEEAMHSAVKMLYDQLETQVPTAQQLDALERLLLTSQQSPYAETEGYTKYVELALIAVQTLRESQGDETRRAARDAIETLIDELPSTELSDHFKEQLNSAIAVAKTQATAAIVEPMLGPTWKEHLDEVDDAVRAQIMAARTDAMQQARSAFMQDWDTRGDRPVYILAGEVARDERGGFERAFTVEGLERGEEYLFRVVAVRDYTLTAQDAADQVARRIVRVESEPAFSDAPVVPAQQWFDGKRFWLMLIVLVICGAVIAYILIARTGKPLKVRKIAGLAAVDEAVGRATEMGRPVLFVPGIQDMNDIQTIAGITVLSRVSRTAAEYDAKVEVPTARSLVMTTARETVQSSFLAAGRPDAFNEDLIYYVTDEQFGYVAYLQGMMSREKPAACFYMGTFFAESLILAETGNSIGAIQVAGTAMPAQLPFFVAACDYTLIGEEFFAASAYLSGEPDQLGSLKGQDVGKIIVAAGVLIGVVLATLAGAMQQSSPDSGMTGFLLDAVEFFKDTMLK